MKRIGAFVLGAFLAGHGYGAAVVIPAMIIAGGLLGLANGILTQRLKISSFIATLGVGIIPPGLRTNSSSFSM